VRAPEEAAAGYARRPLELPLEAYGRLLERSVERFPAKTAIVFRDRRISYEELARLVGALAAGLRGLGVSKGDRVALFMPNCPEYVVAWYACARIGAVATLVNPALREDEVAYQLADSGARVAISGAAQTEVATAAARKVGTETLVALGERAPAGALRFDRLLADHAGAAAPAAEIDPDVDLLALPYSSGTTGLPKGVMLTHRNLVANNLQFTDALAARAESVLLLYLPFYHIYGCMLMGGAIAAGATQVIMERFEPEACLASIQEHRITHWFAVPPILLHLAGYEGTARYDLASVEIVMTGAAPLPPEVGRRFADRTGLRVLQAYGLTEASPLTHANPADAPDLCRLDSVGFSVANQEQEIVDLETGERALAPGEVGELRIRGPHVMKGYWRAPELTAATLRGGWLYTGDVGFLTADGRFTITDRKKEMIKYKAFGVAPAELEAVLHEHPAVADAAVVAKPDAACGEIPKAFVVLRAGARASAEELAEFVAARVAGYKKVREVEFVDAIPRNPSGKILRRVLREREAAARAAGGRGAGADGSTSNGDRKE
jgi:long-chain acyl-CoA synthetase